jgi:hypothetical protein
MKFEVNSGLVLNLGQLYNLANGVNGARFLGGERDNLVFSKPLMRDWLTAHLIAKNQAKMNGQGKVEAADGQYPNEPRDYMRAWKQGLEKGVEVIANG